MSTGISAASALRRRKESARANVDSGSAAEQGVRQPVKPTERSALVYLLAATCVFITAATAWCLYPTTLEEIGSSSASPAKQLYDSVVSSTPSLESALEGFPRSSTSEWGPYRTGTFFGLRDLSPFSPLIGLMWHDNERRDWPEHIRHDVISDDTEMPQLQHIAAQLNLEASNLTSAWVPVNEGVSRVEHTRAHPDGYFLQTIVDRDLNITTEFVRLPHGQFRALVSVCAVGHCGDSNPAPVSSPSPSTVAPERIITLLPYIQQQHPRYPIRPAPQLTANTASAAAGASMHHTDLRSPFVMHIPHQHSMIDTNTTSDSLGSLLLTRPLPWPGATSVSLAHTLDATTPISALMDAHLLQAKQCIDREPTPELMSRELNARMAAVAPLGNHTSAAVNGSAVAVSSSLQPLDDGREELCGSRDGVRVAVAANRKSFLPFDLPLRPPHAVSHGTVTRLPVAMDAYYYDDDYSQYSHGHADRAGHASTSSWPAQRSERYSPQLSPDLRARVREQYIVAQRAHHPIFAALQRRAQELRKHRATSGKVSVAGKNPGYFRGLTAAADFPYLHTGLDGHDHCRHGAGATTTLCVTVWEATLALPLRFEIMLADAAAMIAASKDSSHRAALLTAVGRVSANTTRVVADALAASTLYAAVADNAHLRTLHTVVEQERSRLIAAEDAVVQRLWSQRTHSDNSVDESADQVHTVGNTTASATHAPSAISAPPAFLRPTLASLVAGTGYHEGASRMAVTVAPASATLPPPPLSLTSAITLATPAYLPLPPLHQSLLTLSPSRQCFPRGFLWDEGMHHYVLAQTHPTLSRAVLRSWAALTHRSGWLPREQILGTEAQRRVPADFQLQRDDIANPPTQMLAVAAMTARELRAVWESQRWQGVLLHPPRALDTKLIPALGVDAAQHLAAIDFSRLSCAEDVYAQFCELTAFLASVLPAYRAQAAWFVRSQASSYDHAVRPTALPLNRLNDMRDTYTYNSTSGLYFDDEEGIFNPPARSATNASANAARVPSTLAWRQRSKYHALASGLDDYPRLPMGPSPLVLLEGHVDAAAWAVAAMDALYALHRVLLLAHTDQLKGDAQTRFTAQLQKHVDLSAEVSSTLYRAMFRNQYDLHTHTFGDFAVLSAHYTRDLQLRFDAGWYDLTSEATPARTGAAQARLVKPASVPTYVSNDTMVSAPAPLLQRSRDKLDHLYRILDAQVLTITTSQRPFLQRSRALNDLRTRSAADVEQAMRPGHTWVHHLGYVAFAPLFTHALRIHGRMQPCERAQDAPGQTLSSPRLCFTVPLLLASTGSGNRGFQHPAYTATRRSGSTARTTATPTPADYAPLFPSAFAAPKTAATSTPPLVSPLSVLSRALSLLSSPALLAPHGPRSLALGDPYYGTGEDYWRGSVWAPVAYLLWRAVVQYGREVRAMRAEVDAALVSAYGAGEQTRMSALVEDRWRWAGLGIPDATLLPQHDRALADGVQASESDWTGELSLRDASFALGYLDKQCSVLARTLRSSFTSTVAAGHEQRGFLYEQYRGSDGAGARCKPFTGWTALAALMAVGDGSV